MRFSGFGTGLIGTPFWLPYPKKFISDFFDRPFLDSSPCGKYLIDKSFNQYSKKAILNQSRLKTLHSLLNTIFHYTLGFFFIYAILSAIGVPIGSLLAGAGIAGVAIGLGAQGFMSDVITGFFIIMEQQMDVGTTSS